MMIEENTVVKAYPLQIMPDGRAIFPQEFVRQLSPNLNSVCLFQIGDLALLLSTPPRLMELTQDFANLMENQEVSLDNLLEGLQEERLAIWEQLPEALQIEILHYVEVLLEKYAKSLSETKPFKKRRAGYLKGKIWMADDFDAPLEEFKDYT